MVEGPPVLSPLKVRKEGKKIFLFLFHHRTLGQALHQKACCFALAEAGIDFYISFVVDSMWKKWDELVKEHM